MFPLGRALLPGEPVPLRVFEPRYVALMESVLGGDREFGVVLISRGWEVGGGDERLDIGTMAAEHLQAHRKQWKLGLAAKWLLNRSHSLPGDFVSYVLFDGAFASKLIKLGRDDARLRAGEIRSFFAR